MPRKGYQPTSEHIQNMSKGKTGKKRKPFTEEHKANMRKAWEVRKQKKRDELQTNSKQDR